MSSNPLPLLFAETLQQQATRQGRRPSPINRAVSDIVFSAGMMALDDTRSGKQSKTFKVVSAPTGSGKTNSVLAFIIAAAKHDPEFTCGLIVEEIVHAEENYRALCEELSPDVVGVWSSYHDPRSHREVDFDKYGFKPTMTHLDEMPSKRVVVFTHAKWQSEMSSGKDFGVRKCNGKLRDVLFIDEQPDAIQIMEMIPADIYLVRDEVQRCDPEHEWVAPLTAVAERMSEAFGTKGLEHDPVQLIECLDAYDFTEDKALAFWRSHHGLQDSARFIEGIKFLQACSLGYCFLSRQAPRSFVAYLPAFKPESNQVILDATADLSGLYLYFLLVCWLTVTTEGCDSYSRQLVTLLSPVSPF